MRARFTQGISLIILVFIALQTATSFRLLCLPENLGGVAFPLRVCDPQLWPFLAYPMYNSPHYPGDLQNRPRMFGILHDNSKVSISSNDLGLTVTQFVELHHRLLKAKKDSEIQLVADLFERKRGRQLAILQLGNHPVRFNGSRFVPADPVILASFRISNGAGQLGR